MDVDPHTVKDISELTVKEIRAYISGLLTVPNAQRAKKDSLVEYILAKADPSCIEHLWKAGQERRAERDRNREKADIGRKQKRNEQQNTRRVAQRTDHDSTGAHDGDSNQSDPSLNSFLRLPTPGQLKDCYRAFYNATSNKALASATCGICARNVNISEQKVTHFKINSLPNAHRLIPRNPHAAHTLFDGKLLEPRGVRNEGSDFLVTACKDCVSSLNKPKDVPPEYSLANNMWIGDIPWELQRLTFPEQLLVARIYPRVYVFKLFPKKYERGHDASTLQWGMRGNVSSYELNVDAISSMVHGNLMPHPPAVLASIISVTFIGLGELPRKWLHSTFRVRRHAVFEALTWLKTNNRKYYGDIDIDPERLGSLPDDDVPMEILGIVRQTEDIGLIDQESDSYVPADDSAEPSEFSIFQLYLPGSDGY